MNKLRILLIDDNPDDRALVIRELRREFPGLEVNQIIEAQSLNHALEGGDFDMVVTDYQLLWSNGLEILRTVKKRWPDCPVIMFTGTGSEEVAVASMKAGLDDYVIKSPKHFSRLPASIRLAQEKVKQRQALREAETRYRDLFDRIPIGLYRSAPDGQFLDANPAMVQTLGYPSREDLLVVNAHHLYVDTEELEQWSKIIKEKSVIRDFEARLRRWDGTIIWARWSANVVRDEQGEILYYEGALLS